MTYIILTIKLTMTTFITISTLFFSFATDAVISSFNNAFSYYLINVSGLAFLVNNPVVNNMDIIVKALLNFPFKKQFFFVIDSAEIAIGGAQDAIANEVNLLPYIVGGAALVLAGAGLYVFISASQEWRHPFINPNGQSKFLEANNVDLEKIISENIPCSQNFTLGTSDLASKQMKAGIDCYSDFMVKHIYPIYSKTGEQLLDNIPKYQDYSYLVSGLNDTVFNMCLNYEASSAYYIYLMNHCILFINNTPESFMLDYIMAASDLASTTPPGLSLKELIKASLLSPSELKSIYQYTHTYDEMMLLTKNAQALRSNWETFFLREMLCYYPHLRYIPFLELEMASRLADPCFRDSIYAQALPDLEQLIASKVKSSVVFDSIQLPSLSSTSTGPSQAMLYAERLRLAIDIDSSVEQGQFEFLRWLRLTSFCKRFFPSAYKTELKGKYVWEDDFMKYMD